MIRTRIQAATRFLARTARRIALALALILAAVWLIGERGVLLRRSSWRVLRELGPRWLLSGKGLHAYLYARWPELYIGRAIQIVIPRLADQPPARRWADHYHGKIVTTEDARQLITVNEPLRVDDLEQIVPYAHARKLVLDGPPDIVVMECPCRAARENPCQPTDVCMIVGQPFTGFMLEHHPHTSRRITQAEALDLLHAEHERGHIHAAYFKDVMADRFYAICNCCGCCCGGIEAMQRLGVPMVAASGYVAQIDAMQCSACGVCEDMCPFQAIRVNGHAAIDWAACMGCGVCVDQCIDGALTLVRDAGKGEPLDVRVLRAAAGNQ